MSRSIGGRTNVWRALFALSTLSVATSGACTCESPTPRRRVSASTDAGVATDADMLDASTPDVGALDAGALDADVPDGNAPDANALDAGAPAIRPTTTPPDPRTAVRATIASLTALLAGELPVQVDPQALFEIDLLDDAARAHRIATLRASIEERAAQRTAQPTPDVTPNAGSDAGPMGDGGIEAVPAPVSTVLDPAILRRGSPDELEALLLARDRLRLRFLLLPENARATVFDAIRRRRRLAAEAEASLADVARAVDDQRRAAAARQEALDQATASESAIERDLLSERARLEDTRSDLAQWAADLARRRQHVTGVSAERLELLHGIESRLASMSSSEVDRRYEDVVEALVADRSRLDDALDKVSASSTVPSFEATLEPTQALYADFPAHAELIDAVVSFHDERRSALGSETTYRWDRVERIAEDVRALDQLRVQLLPRMSTSRRETVLGWGADGRAQLEREVSQIRLMARYWFRRVWNDLPDTPRTIGALLARSSTRNEVFGILAILAALVWVARRRDRLAVRVQKWFDRVGDRPVRGIVRPFSVLGPIAISAVLVAGLYGAFALADELFVESMALSLLRIVVVNTVWFAVIVRAVTRIFVSRLRHHSGRANTARRILASVRLVLGFVLAIVILLELSELLVGRGYLYSLVVIAASILALPIAFILVHRWSADVLVAHRERYPEGLIDKQLAARDSRALAYLLTPPASAQLAWVGATTSLKDLALRFDQARSGFAFLFRRRLEKQSEGDAIEVDVDSLPERLVSAFSFDTVSEELELDHYVGLDAVVERLQKLEDGGDGFGVALVGERGLGKSSWMRALGRRTNIGVEYAEVPAGLDDGAALCLFVANLLGIEPADNVDAIEASVLASESPRIVMLDHCQNLVLRVIGGSVGLEALVEIVARTSPRVVWICAFSRYTWMYLAAVRQSQNLFSESVVLEPWSAEEIGELIQHRMRVAGETASFRGLVVDKLAGSALEDAVLRSEEEYIRLLWDYSLGNPRIAMHFWLRSLVPTEAGLRVRLFVAPNVDALEGLHEHTRFVLAAIALHENLSMSEIARTTAMEPSETAALLAFLDGAAYVHEDTNGKWRINTHWYRAISRFLRRKRLLFE